MERLPSLGSVSDDGSYDISTGPLTPNNTSPFLGPIETGIVLEKSFRHCSPEVAARKDSWTNVKPQLARHPPSIQSLCFIGAGYVGAPTAAVIALHNPSIQVYVLDRDEARIQKWRSAHLPIHEPGLDRIVRAARDGATLTRGDEECPRCPNLFFTNNSDEALSRADMIFLAVNTPTKTFGQGSGRATNMNAVDGAVRDIARFAKDDIIIVEKSTVPCGTARRISKYLRSARPDMSFEVVSNPEFLAESCAVKNLLHPDRVLIGSSRSPSGHRAASALATLYKAWVPEMRVLQTNTWSSELAKLVANAMLAQRISSINSISAVCEATGANIAEVAASIGMDPRIGPKFLNAGLGFGGSCFRKDIASLVYLAESLGLQEVAEYWEQVNKMNELQRRHFTRNVIKELDENLQGKKIALLGFAFKAGTGDVRESLAVDIIGQLLQERPAEIAIYDPYCKPEDIRQELEAMTCQRTETKENATEVYTDPYPACMGAEAVLVITDCAQFKVGQPHAAPCADVDTAASHTDSNSISLPDGSSLLLVPQSDCVIDCRVSKEHESATTSSERIDWRRIASSMRGARLVYDGRCFLDAEALGSLGVRVRSIGKSIAS